MGFHGGWNLRIGEKLMGPRIWTPAEDILGRYRTSQGTSFVESKRTGFACVPVLQFLWGQELTLITFGWIHSLRPSYVRIIDNGHSETCDAMPGRVTINLADDNKHIAKIDQEVSVSLYGDVEHGHDLRVRTAPDGWPEPVWHVDQPSPKSADE